MIRKTTFGSQKTFANVSWNEMFEILRKLGLKFMYNRHNDTVASIRAEYQERQGIF